MKKLAGLLFAKDYPHLDHIAPLCALLHIPLLVTDSHIEALATQAYPDLTVKRYDAHKIAHVAVKEFDVIISCLPRQLLTPLFFFEENLHKKKLLTIWLSHGQSDKDNLSALSQEKLALIYGPLMLERFKQAKVFDNLFKTLFVGNYRREYFLKHLEFYRAWLENTLYFPEKQTTIFFAPSWENPQIAQLTEEMVETLPSHCNLIVKLHPNSLQQGFTPRLKEQVAEKPNIIWLDESPLIYPILSRADIYVGDYSSIAYDFLSFNRPMFFLSKAEVAIHKAGINTTVEALFTKITEKDALNEEREKLYINAFADIDSETLPTLINDTIAQYFSEEIHTL